MDQRQPECLLKGMRNKKASNQRFEAFYKLTHL